MEAAKEPRVPPESVASKCRRSGSARDGEGGHCEA